MRERPRRVPVVLLAYDHRRDRRRSGRGREGRDRRRRSSGRGTCACFARSCAPSRIDSTSEHDATRVRRPGDPPRRGQRPLHVVFPPGRLRRAPRAFPAPPLRGDEPLPPADADARAAQDPPLPDVRGGLGGLRHVSRRDPRRHLRRRAPPRTARAPPRRGSTSRGPCGDRCATCPIVLQSFRDENGALAIDAGASFLLKGSPTLLHDLRRFMTTYFGFGDFIFRLPDGTDVGRARDMKELEESSRDVPAESIAYHAERNHFSKWLKARTEFAARAAPQARARDRLRDPRRPAKEPHRGDRRVPAGPGSNARRRLRPAHVRSGRELLPHRRRIPRRKGAWTRLRAGTPRRAPARRAVSVRRRLRAAVRRPRHRGLRPLPRREPPSRLRDQLRRRRRAPAPLSRRLVAGRGPSRPPQSYLARVHEPIAVRSSSLLEDSQYQPFTGVYDTYMLTNQGEPRKRLERLVAAIKRIYASTFSSRAKSYVKATPYRLEEEKMAVILQAIVGARRGDRFYPDFAGVARSYNFYPAPPMTAADGIAAVALGFGQRRRRGRALRALLSARSPARSPLLLGDGHPRDFADDRSGRSISRVVTRRATRVRSASSSLPPRRTGRSPPWARPGRPRTTPSTTASRVPA